MEVPECYFHSSLWVKQVKKASPDSDFSSSQYSVILSQKIARLSEDKSGYSVQGRLEDSRETDRRLSYSCLFFALWSFPLVIPHPPPSSEEWGQEELAPWVWFVTLTCSPLETLSTRPVHKSSVWQSLSHLETFFCDGRSQRIYKGMWRHLWNTTLFPFRDGWEQVSTTVSSTSFQHCGPGQSDKTPQI